MTPADTLRGLQPGSMIETVPVLAGLTDDPLLFQCTERAEPTTDRVVLTFDVWYLDTQIERLAVSIEGEKVTWAAI